MKNMYNHEFLHNLFYGTDDDDNNNNNNNKSTLDTCF